MITFAFARSPARSLRRDAGVTVREVAALLGVTPMTVMRWEACDVTPRREHAVKYRQLLDALEEAVA